MCGNDDKIRIQVRCRLDDLIVGDSVAKVNENLDPIRKLVTGKSLEFRLYRLVDITSLKRPRNFGSEHPIGVHRLDDVEEVHF